MKKNFYLILFVTFFGFMSSQGFCTMHLVSTAGSSFSPATLTIIQGDTVVFNVASGHNATEVSQATWNANGATSNGGFAFNPPGNLIQLNLVQTYYYVCTFHASFGMKGQITVTSATGINSPTASLKGLEIYPNPVTHGSSWINIKTNLQSAKANDIRIYNILGNCLYMKDDVPSTGSIDVAGLPSGVYFIEVRSDEIIQEKKLVISR